MSNIKTFVLVSWDEPHTALTGDIEGTDLKGKEGNSHMFRSRQARAAALKAANRGVKKIALRERGSKSGLIHFFKGTREEWSKVPGDPEWLPDPYFTAEVKKWKNPKGKTAAEKQLTTNTKKRGAAKAKAKADGKAARAQSAADKKAKSKLYKKLKRIAGQDLTAEELQEKTAAAAREYKSSTNK